MAWKAFDTPPEKKRWRAVQTLVRVTAFKLVLGSLLIGTGKSSSSSLGVVSGALVDTSYAKTDLQNLRVNRSAELKSVIDFLDQSRM